MKNILLRNQKNVQIEKSFPFLQSDIDFITTKLSDDEYILTGKEHLVKHGTLEIFYKNQQNNRIRVIKNDLHYTVELITDYGKYNETKLYYKLCFSRN